MNTYVAQEVYYSIISYDNATNTDKVRDKFEQQRCYSLKQRE